MFQHNIVKRDAVAKRTLYREKVDPDMGGKIPESHYHRDKFNKLDASGLKDSVSQAMSDSLKDKKLPQKMDPSTTLLEGDDAVALPFTFTSSQFPSFADEFPFESNKVFNFKEENQFAKGPPPPQEQIKYPKETEYYNDIENDDKGYGDIPKKKPHLFTQDPYVSGIANDYNNEPKFKPPPQGYLPPVGPYNTEFDGYQGPPSVEVGYQDEGGYDPPPYHPEEETYHDPEFGPEYAPPPANYAPIPQHDGYGHPTHDEYAPVHEEYGPVHEEYGPVHDEYGHVHEGYGPGEEEYGPIPVHDDYGPPPSDGYGPPSSDYGAPSADYGPPKIVGPVLLEKRPYEVKEIKAVPIVTHKTYTKFDCRNVPYPDRHYADPEAGCAVS